MGRKPKKKKPNPTDRMEKTTALVKEGYSLKKAMELAGYSKSTIEKKASEYLRRLDLDELKRGLRVQAGLSSYTAFKTLDEKMQKAEKEGDQIKAADAVLRAGKTYLGTGDAPTKLTFVFQTFGGETKIDMSSSEKSSDEIIDISPKKDEEDKL